MSTPVNLRDYRVPESVTLTDARRVRVVQTLANRKLLRNLGVRPVAVDGTPHPDPNARDCWTADGQWGEPAVHEVVLPAGTTLWLNGYSGHWTHTLGQPGTEGARVWIRKDHPDPRLRNVRCWLTARQLYTLPEWPRV
jgi:hypothetical protein